MSDLIATAASIPMFGYKEHLLMFDRIATPNVERQLQEFLCSPLFRGVFTQIARDVQMLVDRGIWFDANTIPLELGAESQAEWDRQWRRVTDSSPTESPLEPTTRREDAAARLISIRLRSGGKMNAVPMMFDWAPFPDEVATQATALHIIVKRFPQPRGDLPLQEILKFRERARDRGLVQKLRNWTTDTASGTLEADEVSDTLEAVLSDYENALRDARMARDFSHWQTIVITTARIADSFLTCRWSDAVTRLFEITRRQIDLTNVENSAPGREVAFLVKAQERFALV